MRFFFLGPRFLGIRPGIVLSPRDFQRSRAPAAEIEGSFLYVMQAHRLVKVGVTKNPRDRLRTLQTACPWPLDFEAIMATPGTGYDIEELAHSALAPYLVRGEWFSVPPEMAIEAVQHAAHELRQPLLNVSLDRVDAILAIAQNLPQSPARQFGWDILWWLTATMLILVVLATIGKLSTP